MAEVSPNLKDVFILLENCDDERIGVVAITKSKYAGFGFTDKDSGLRPDDLIDIIEKYPENKDVRQIIRTYLNTKKDYRILSL
jgi:hypothetical protein